MEKDRAKVHSLGSSSFGGGISLHQRRNANDMREKEFDGFEF